MSEDINSAAIARDIGRMIDENARLRAALQQAVEALDRLQDHHCSGMCGSTDSEDHMPVMEQTNAALTAAREELQK